MRMHPMMLMAVLLAGSASALANPPASGGGGSGGGGGAPAPAGGGGTHGGGGGGGGAGGGAHGGGGSGAAYGGGGVAHDAAGLAAGRTGYAVLSPRDVGRGSGAWVGPREGSAAKAVREANQPKHPFVPRFRRAISDRRYKQPCPGGYVDTPGNSGVRCQEAPITFTCYPLVTDPLANRLRHPCEGAVKTRTVTGSRLRSS